MTTTCAAIAALAMLCYLLLLAAAHVRGEYHPVRHAVSDYAVGPTARLFQGMGICTALGAAALVPPVAAHAGFSRRWVVVGMLAVLALGRLLVVVFPTDLEGERSTRAGRLHLLFAVVTFGVSYSIASQVTSRLDQLGIDGAWMGLLGGLRWAALAALVAVVVSMVLPAARRVFGLAERCFLVAVNVWFLCFALALALG